LLHSFAILALPSPILSKSHLFLHIVVIIIQIVYSVTQLSYFLPSGNPTLMMTVIFMWKLNCFLCIIFRGNPNVTLTLSWNIIPNAGLLPSIFALGEHVFHFPSEYTTSRV
jgi:hypothetical protein